MARASEAAISHCHKATVLGNKISIRMLEFLSTSENPPHGFEDLAREFLETSRIMWSIEAGLNEFSRTNQRLPQEMINELDKKFKTTSSDFQSLDMMLGRYLEYERRGTVGKIQRGWRKMFEGHDVDKMREALNKTREALNMSALVFQWSLGEAKIDESVGIGYTGLAAALERMDQLKSGPVRKIRSSEYVSAPGHELDPALLSGLNLDSRSAGDAQSVRHGGDAMSFRGTPTFNVHQLPPIVPLPDLGRRTSLSNFTVTSHEREHREPSTLLSTGYSAGIRDTITASHTTRTTPSTTSDRSVHDYAKLGEHPDTPMTEMDSWDTTPFKVVRITAEPLTMPRRRARTNAGADVPALRAALIAAVEDRNHRMVEELLDRGVRPEGGSEHQFMKNAIRQHDLETVRLLLVFGSDPNAPDTFGVTPLYAAVEQAFLDGASLLLKYGADPNAVAGPEPDSPLAKAIVDDRSNITHILLTYGGDPNHIMSDNETILIKAIIKKRSKKLIDMLLEYGSDPNAKNGEGTSPLFEAIQSNRPEILTTLLDHGANPNLPGPKHMLWPAVTRPNCLQILLDRGADHKKTPGIIELATSFNKIESVRILLKAGANPNCKKDGVWTGLCTSIRDNRADIFHLLLANGADPNLSSAEYPCFKCVTHNRLQYLEPLVAAGATLNSPKGILETAVQFNNIEAVKWLLDHGVAINDKVPKIGATALTTAIRDNRIELLNLLLARGADPHIRGEDWPLCMAVRRPEMLKRLLPTLAEPRAFKGVMEMAVVANQLESVKLLLAAGVSVEDRNGGVFSPLTTAIRERHKDIVKFLLNEGGADPNAPGEHLPIIKALRRMEGEDTEILEMLLDKGADPNKVYRGHNAFIQALENGDNHVLKVLVDRCDVNLDAKDEMGATVAQIANRHGSEEAREILLHIRP